MSNFMLNLVEHEKKFYNLGTWSCYKTFFMLNSADHKIYPAHKCKNANILTFISRINTTSERLKARNFFILWYLVFMSS